jgi:hypothetical protein
LAAVCGHNAGRAVIENRQDWADMIGRRIATVFIVLLAAMFAYGYLGWLVGG